MKPSLRIALPALEHLTLQSEIAWALLDRQSRVLRSGEARLENLAALLPQRDVVAILHPHDTVVVTVDIPPLPTGRLKSAVQARIEPMALSDTRELAVAHGPRMPDGRLQAAWTSRRRIEQAWQCLSQAGLDIQAFIPLELALPPGDPHPDQALTLPADARWQAALPGWSLAHAEWRPVRAGRPWARSLRWVAAAVLLWLGGMHLYAAQLRSEVETLKIHMETRARTAFPAVPVWLDPLRQVQTQLDPLRLTQGQPPPDSFMPLALDTAHVMEFAAGHVTALRFEDQQLTLSLAEGYAPPTDDSTLQRQAAAKGLTITRDAGQPHVWQVGREPRQENRP